MKTIRCREGGGTAPATAHRQTVCRLLPQRRTAWRRFEAMLEQQRQLCNAALEERIHCHRKTGKGMSYFDQCRALTECRRDIPRMAACPVAVQRGTLKRLDEAFRHFFRRAKAGGAPGFPKFRGRRFFSGVSIVSGVKVRDGTLRIPSFGALFLSGVVSTPVIKCRTSKDCGEGVGNSAEVSRNIFSLCGDAVAKLLSQRVLVVEFGSGARVTVAKHSRETYDRAVSRCLMVPAITNLPNSLRRSLPSATDQSGKRTCAHECRTAADR